MQLPNQSQIVAFGRHVISYSAGAVSAGMVLHLISTGQGQDLGEAIRQISTGVASIIAGAMTILATASGVWAAWKQSPFATLLQASKVIGNSGQIVLKDPKLAAALPANVIAIPANTSGKGQI
jgi:hypothetical protein